MRRASLSLIRTSATFALWVHTAQLQAAEPDAEMRTTARELARQGAELAQAGKCNEAIDIFERAYSLVPAPTIAVHEARCLAQLGRLLESVDRYELVQRSPLDQSAPQAFAEAQEEARSALLALRPRIPRLKVEISGALTDDPSLVVMLNDKELPRALLGVDRPIDPGTYEITARAKGKNKAHETVEVAEGANEVVELELESLESKPAAKPASEPEPIEEPAQVEQPSSMGRKLGFVIVGLGVAGVGTGVATALVAQSKEKSLEQTCDGLSCPASASADIDALNLMRTLSFVGYGVGIAGIATGAIVIMSTGSSSSSARTEVGVGFQSAYVRGTF